MAKLFMMCGLSESGKSTLAKNISEQRDAVLVSSDAIREELSFYEDQSRNDEVFRIFHKRIADSLKNGIDCIADATNLTIKSRKTIIDIGKKYNSYIVCELMVTPWIACVARDVGREHSVGEEVIIKQLKRFQVPFFYEGFDEINMHTSMPINYQTKNWKRDALELMTDFDQKTPYHKHLLLEHSNLATEAFCDKIKNDEYLVLKGAILDGARWHDLGKLYTQTFDDDGIAHYYNHENIGAYIYITNRYHSERRCYETNDSILEGAFLINYHMRPFGWKTEKAKERARKTFGGYWFDLLTLFNECDEGA